MPATVWSPAPYYSKSEWLLQNGTIVTSPEIETSTSGRVVRVTGTKNSISSRSIDMLVEAAIDELAAARGTKRWMRTWPEVEEEQRRAGVVGSHDGSLFTTAAVFKLPEDNSRRDAVTTLLWDFKATSGLPLYATIFLSLHHYNGRTTVSTKVVWRDTNPNQDACSYYLHDGQQMQLGKLHRHSDEYRQAEKLLADRDGVLPAHRVDTTVYQGQLRQAISEFASRAKALDDLGEVSLLDMTNPAVPALMKFTRKRSNYSAQVHEEILALVQTGPLIEKIKNAYTELTAAMNQLGIVFENKPGDNEFARAAAGDLTALRASIRPTDDTDRLSSGIDNDHTVVIDMASGSVIVNCAHTTSQEEISTAWEIAQMRALGTGELDILLEYAKAYREPKEQARIKKILKQRATPDNLK